MNTNTLALLLAFLGAAIGVATLVPQIIRIAANPKMQGVSPWTWSLIAVSCSLWLTYGVRTVSLPQIPGNVLIIAGAVAIVLMVPAGWSRTGRALALAGAMSGLIVASTLLEPAQAGFLAFGVGLVAAWPQVFETVWARRGMGPSAISLTSTALGVTAQLCWFAFAVMTMDRPVIAGSAMALTTGALVGSVELGRRRTAPAAAAVRGERVRGERVPVAVGAGSPVGI